MFNRGALKKMRAKSILGFFVGAVMIAGFFVQMWDVFNLFHSGMKTVAISFEERDKIEFPSFAVCDSRAYNKTTPWTANGAKYNATTFNFEEEVSLLFFGNEDEADDWNTYTKELLPTIFNGYCILYEFQRAYPVKAFAGKAKNMLNHNKRRY